MASITLKDLPEDLHGQLRQEAEANHRSLNQEAIVRLERTFVVDDQWSAATVSRLIGEAVESGPAEPFSWEKFHGAVKQGKAAAARTKTA